MSDRTARSGDGSVFVEHRLPAFHPYFPPSAFAGKIPDDNERPRRYSGNSHQRRKQRRAQREPPMTPNGRRAWRRFAHSNGARSTAGIARPARHGSTMPMARFIGTNRNTLNSAPLFPLDHSPPAPCWDDDGGKKASSVAASSIRSVPL